MKTLITAHAGAENTAPNTLESIRALACLSVDALEVDVRLHDGVLILTHNEAKAGTTYATLEECFRIVAPHEGLMLNLDLKESNLTPLVDALATRCGMAGRFLFTGEVGASDTDYVHAHGLAAWYNESLLDETERKDTFAALESRGFSVLNTHYSLVANERIAQFGAERFSVWTVDDEDEQARLLSKRVLNLTTRRPLLALALRKKLQD